MNQFYVQCDTADDGCGTKYPGDLDTCPKCGAATSLISIPAMLPVNVYVYDIETYPNIFTCAIIHPFTGTKWMFEISDRMNQIDQLLEFLWNLHRAGAKMVGYNNNHFDYQVLHWIMVSQVPVTVEGIYAKSQAIFAKSDSMGKPIYERQFLIKQIDLFKIHHFDNKAKRTSLKALEFFMRMKNIRDLPYPPGTVLNNHQKDVLISYNWHDVDATVMFWVRTLEMIEFRTMLGAKYGKDFTNHNDAKIGSTIFQIKLEQAGIACYENRNVRQTHRASVNLSECIPDYIQFEHPEFQRILEVFKSTVLKGTNVKALFKDFNCTIDGITYVFGSGGQHAARPGLFESNNEYMILDLDVAGEYPNIMIENTFYPEHLGPRFCPIFKEILTERNAVGKNTSLGKGLKLSANGTYGKLGDKYSFVFDLKTLLSVTLTGQLALSMLVEQVMKIDGAIILQTNTDGFTVRMKRVDLPFVKQLVAWWEGITRLEMEYNYYSRLWLKNVNSYIAEDEKTSKLKLKKDYNYKLEYHKDASSLVVPKAIEHYLVHGQDIRDYITNHKDPYDFCIRAKVPRSNKLVMRWGEFGDQEMQMITRYFIGKTGGQLVKIAPTKGIVGEYKRANKLTDAYFNQIIREIGYGIWDERIHQKNKKKYEPIDETCISAGWKSVECNDIDNFNWKNLNYDYYIAEASKLVI